MIDNHETLGNMPAAVTRDCAIASEFHYWLGLSGKRYLHTVFAIDTCPEFEFAVFLAVGRDPCGRRQALVMGTMGSTPALVLRGRVLTDARRRGANEIHLHLMAATAAERRTTLHDIAGRQQAPVMAHTTRMATLGISH